MMTRWRVYLVTTWLAGLGISPVMAGAGGGDDAGLAARARTVLETHCYRCHGVRQEVEGYNVLDRETLLRSTDGEESPFVSPGNPDASRLWIRAGVIRDMPPSGRKPTDEERATLKAWIEAGAPASRAADETDGKLDARPFVTESQVLAAIRDDLRRAPEGDRPYLRYFTLHNLHNNKSFTLDDLRLARAALSKLVNSLSWSRTLVIPRSIDATQVVFSIDLREVGWDVSDLWRTIISAYPYGLSHEDAEDAVARTATREIAAMVDAALPCVRVDWFVVNAARPPLYDRILDLPRSSNALEALLRIDVESNARHDKVKRAGIVSSGIATQNRVLERHLGSGVYWRSYDFRTSEGTGNIFRRPLGPASPTNPYPRHAFEHAGSEIIFSLPKILLGGTR